MKYIGKSATGGSVFKVSKGSSQQAWDSMSANGASRTSWLQDAGITSMNLTDKYNAMDWDELPSSVRNALKESKS